MRTSVTRVRPSDRRRVAWRNGAGVTEEIAAGDAGQWRVSVADLGHEPSKFSTFEGLHRVFTVIGPKGVTLAWGDGSAVIQPLQPFPFDGSLAPTCAPDGATRAFNVMVQKTAGRVTVSTRQLNRSAIVTLQDRISLVYVTRGDVSTRGVEAIAGDCLVVEHDVVVLHGDASVIVAEVDLDGLL